MFRRMSEIELTINEIDKVRMIDIYELTGIKDDPEAGCVAISVFYGGDKHLNLCELDQGFEILAGRIFEIYDEYAGKKNSESNEVEIISDEIVMDEKTRRILECGRIGRNEEFLESYYKISPVEIPDVAFESAEAERFIPLVSYMLQGLYLVNGKKMEVTGVRNGWRGAGVIYGLLNGERLTFGLKISQTTDDRYIVKVCNFLEQGNFLEAEIVIRNREIILKYASEKVDFKGISIFNLHENGYSERHEAFKDGVKIFCDTWGKREMEKIALTKEEMTLIPWKCDEKAFHSLPWGMVFIFDSERTDKGDWLVTENRCCHLYKKARYSENRCWTRVKNRDTALELNISSVRMLRLLLGKGRSQTYFVPCTGIHSERYVKYLQGRNFVLS